jgi:hypothetical protein
MSLAVVFLAAMAECPIETIALSSDMFHGEISGR